MSTLTFEQAKATEGQLFRMVIDGGIELPLTLTSVQPLRGSARFSMLFTGTSGHRCAQQIYTLKNEKLGELRIFLVPVGQDEASGDFRYQAVFS
jgi:hypothetical protein